MRKKKIKKGISMRKVREILRLSLECNLNNRQIALSSSVSHTSVNRYIRHAKESGITYSKIESMSDLELLSSLKLINPINNVRNRPHPDWGLIHTELKKKSVTRQLLYEEYKDQYPKGLGRTQFYDQYRAWKEKLNVWLRQSHKAGEKLFVDYAGQKIPVIDRQTGEIREAEIFVGVLGASNYTYAEASWSQSLSDWIGSHVRAFEYFQGAPRLIIPDNLRSGVSKACRYEPDINPTYNEMASHYCAAVIPTRVIKPKDKAKVEVGVQIVERWILAALRNRDFFSLSELNDAISELLIKLNNRSFQKMEGTRRSCFESIEQKELQALPSEPYVFAQWKKARVNMDYHVELEKHYYSVPYKMVKKEVHIRYTTNTVEVFLNNKRISSHKRSYIKGQHTTIKDHMPETHKRYLEWTPARIISWAGKTGKSTAQMVETIMKRRQYPEQGYRSCIGIIRLGQRYTDKRLELACLRAITFGAYGYKNIQSILEKGLDQQPLPNTSTESLVSIDHPNIRGEKYYEQNNHLN